MKKLIISSLFATAILTAGATPLSPSEALAAATGQSSGPWHIPAANAATLAYTGTEARAYAFNMNRPEGGFVIVAGDTDFAYPLLGYSETGTINAANMPDGLKWFIDSQRPLPANVVYAPLNKPEIANMVHTKWNQSAPYNNLCPEINGTHCMTGCGATAMAQVMKFWEHPATGYSSTEYYWENGNQKLTYDFTADTYDWTNMTDTYDANSTPAQNLAVAQLMRACGMASSMGYGTELSSTYGINLIAGLVNYFRYDYSIYTAYRKNFSLNGWNELIYNSLAEGEPVIYTGVSSLGGHAFVISGYRMTDNFDYFYVNWGWGGMSDGYFLLSNLDPVNHGIGGGLGAFCLEQSAILNIKPLQQGSDFTPYFIIVGERFVPSNRSVRRSSRVEFSVAPGVGQSADYCGIANYSIVDMTIEYGVKLVPTGGGSPQYLGIGVETNVPVYNGYTGYNIAGESFPASGSYRVTPAVKYAGKWYDVYSNYLTPSDIIVECSESTLTFKSNSDAEVLTISDINIGDGILVRDSSLGITATLTAGHTGFSGLVRPVLINNENAVVAEAEAFFPDLDTNASTDFNTDLHFSPMPENGTYSLVFITEYYEIVSASTTADLKVTVADANIPAKVRVSAASVNGIVMSATTPAELESPALSVKFTLDCSEGNFNSPVSLLIVDSSRTKVIETEARRITLGPGEHVSVTFEATPQLTRGDIYYLTARDTAADKELGDMYPFTVEVEEPENGITEIDADSTGPQTRFYTLQGVRVATPRAGNIYIMQRPLQRPVKVIVR